MISEIQAISGGGLSVLKGVFPPLENRGFTRGLRGRRGRTKREQDKAGSLSPASPHRTATPTGEIGYGKGIPERYGPRPTPKPGVSRLFPADFQANSGRDSGMSSIYGHGHMPGSYKMERMLSMAKQKQSMPSNGVRMPAEMWAKCDEMTAKLGLESRNEYIRNAIEFYTEWCEMSHTQKFLTPALESVIGAKVRDSENRIARALYKMAVQQNALTHVLATAYNWTPDELEKLYDTAEDDARGWNGTLDLRDFDSDEEDE